MVPLESTHTIIYDIAHVNAQWERAFKWRDSHITYLYDETVLAPQLVAQPLGGFCCC